MAFSACACVRPTTSGTVTVGDVVVVVLDVEVLDVDVVELVDVEVDDEVADVDVVEGDELDVVVAASSGPVDTTSTIGDLAGTWRPAGGSLPRTTPAGSADGSSRVVTDPTKP